eukprot:CAMPEP_0201492330 /NCGR_PEP_ID=MMETSP0151_2-20130828/32668_1 /ASSEMBLY_ACC=CAM_ASM_000257 /TAXON_ID=200890 /ORGANISM="Paramoeba atlantica, Strain 621/1 / CCAP 1560/9" /LENGTH=244 /DNA_ID=CAMNT_0047879077 /DNA_START=176 /DNA_END=910 /DNA_ORIENTATION=-
MDDGKDRKKESKKKEKKKTKLSMTKRALIASGGSFNPVHVSHVQMMISAKKHLEEEGYEVIAGYLVAAHNQHVKYKCGDAALPLETRLSLCQRASDDLGCGEWLKADGPYGSAWNYLTVTEKELQKKKVISKHEQVLLVNVMGEDLWVRMGTKNHDQYRVLVVPRKQQPGTQGSLFCQHRRAYLKELEEDGSLLPKELDVSSSRLRSKYSSDEKAVRQAISEGLITDGVGDLIIQHKLHKSLKA